MRKPIWAIIQTAKTAVKHWELQMKVVNEKGKLFGVINVVDLLVVLFILAVVGGVAWKIFGGSISDAASAVQVEKSGADVVYTVRVSGVRQDVADAVIAIGFPQQLGINEGLVASSYITDARTEPATALSTDGKFAQMVEYDRTDIVFTIKARVSKGDFITVGSQEVRIGKVHIVKSQFVEFSGIIESIEFDPADFARG